MKTILVLVDFSRAALNAVNYAVEIAKTCKASLLLLYVCNLPVNFTQVPVSLTMDDDRLNAEAELVKLRVKIHRKTGGGLSIFSEVRNGNFFSEVRLFCEHVRPYLVIMGSQGGSRAEKLVWGGHTLYEMRHLPWTLLAVPYRARFSSIKKVALAWDFQNPAGQLPVQKIDQLISDLGAGLHMVCAGWEDEDAFRSGSTALSARAGFHRLAPVFHYLENKRTSKSIIAFVEKNRFDLLLILPGAHSLLQDPFFSGHTKKFVLHCSVPVVALHAQ
ncbi:universal stress protein [Niabella drilacis]|uniref:Nucleotide-binding universal stress protein, UspA family n=1 Tax=Niabella drilacis (strain DSM 25811 / CCM 8410 / CCUG 62505 / LMG 26954 / E90) TaxID=1285928 RepID=A0A1G6REX8_NIADE|nr:universal stress protein [Niabella drilacis]SDD02605.1 Nucleotide-binding universal stress protein, UspA family [Niabella drilacis]